MASSSSARLRVGCALMPGMQHGSTSCMPTATEMRNLAFEPCRDVREPEPSRPEAGPWRPGGITMTLRIHSLAQSGAARRTLKTREQALQAAIDAAPRGAMDRVWSAGYMTVSLLAIAAAGAIAGGEAANAELRFAAVATGATPLVQDICSAGGAPHARPMAQACASTLARCIPHGVRNFLVRPSVHQRKSA